MLDNEVVHQQVEVNGVRLHFVEAGSGPLVLLLHGFPDFWFSWRFQIPTLAAAGFHVVAPDLRGYNQSAKPRGIAQYRLKILVDDVVGLIRHLGEQRATVVGHDWGGIIGWHLAIHHPKVLERVVILNAPHPAALMRELRTFTQLRRSWYVFFFQLPWLAEAGFRAFSFGLLDRALRRDPLRKEAFTEEDIAAYKAAISQPGALTAAINYYRAAFWATMRQGGWRGPRIVTRTLVRWGEKDRYLGTDLLNGLDQWVRDLRVERIPDASHWVHIDAHERVNQLIIRFVREPWTG